MVRSGEVGEEDVGKQTATPSNTWEVHRDDRVNVRERIEPKTDETCIGMLVDDCLVLMASDIEEGLVLDGETRE